ncbi:hypothetical protein DDZ13_07415 [Coraliomargarita sinensis]|uniref:Uncharacterized protein n=1 Tax=Coraliomargarita sinensis TaxID=2174842 RepID=A0A317ZHC3_9BACT|nr:hypothetical protein [Coraliomargarita sinensis]PXA04352.1 hypothetical protein DDZ13_07415 [Coraliomargarita sinensis]
MTDIDDEQIPEWYAKNLIKLSNALLAYAVEKNKVQGLVADTRTYTYPEGSWQEKACISLSKTMFRGLSAKKLNKESAHYRLGYVEGFLESCFSAMAGCEISESDGKESALLEILNPASEEDDEIRTKQLEQFKDQSKLAQKHEHAEGYANGLKSFLVDEETLRYDSDSSMAYFYMLLFEDQIKLWKSWKEFHDFISEFVEGYSGENRFDACKKMGQSIGFSPNS